MKFKFTITLIDCNDDDKPFITESLENLFLNDWSTKWFKIEPLTFLTDQREVMEKPLFRYIDVVIEENVVRLKKENDNLNYNWRVSIFKTKLFEI